MREQAKVLKIVKQLHDKYKNDPIGWIERYINFAGLNYNSLTPQQIEICEALIEHKRVCVSSGGGIGKTGLEGMLTLWFLSTHFYAVVPTTAPNSKSLEDRLWGEIAFWLKRCKLQDLFELTSGRLRVRGFKEWYAVARTIPREGDANAISGTLAGYHSKGDGSLFFIVDEASDVPDPVYTALEGALTDDGSYVMLSSNPVSTGGYFYDTITDPQGKGAAYKVLQYDARQSPLVSKEFEQAIIARYGKESMMYQAKVLGIPITTAGSVVVAPQKFDKTVERNRMMQEGSIVIGCDVGSGGDPSVLAYRHGNSFVAWDTFAIASPQDLCREICNVIERRYKENKNVVIVVDGLGPGAAVLPLLIEKNIATVIEFKGSEKSSMPTMYKNKRTEGYYRLHKNFHTYHFPVDPPERLKKELANLKFDFSKDVFDMEPKKKFISRVGFSPDHADAMMMTEMAEDVTISISATYIPKPDAINFLIHKEPDVDSKFGKFL